MKNKILVTGGSGFLGSHLCEKLLFNEKNHVLCLDNLFTGNKNNITSLLDTSNFKFIKHDVTSPIELDGINQIYNLACPASPIHYQYNPVQTIKTNVHGAINMLNLAKNNNATILQASTSEVYGDGLQTRSFCYVDDLVDGMIKLMDSRNDFIGPVNIGNPNEFTILELAKKILQLTNSSSQLIFKPLPEDDPIQRKPDIQLAMQELQWEPSIQLEKGLNNTIIYFENMLRETI